MTSHPTYDELHDLGKQIKDKAIDVTLKYAQYIKNVDDKSGLINGFHFAERYDSDNSTKVDHSTGIPLTEHEKKEITSYLDQTYSWVVPSFTQFAHPDPADADGVLQDLLKARTILLPGLTDNSTKGTGGAKSADVWKKQLTPDVVKYLDVPIDEQYSDIGVDVEGWTGQGGTAFKKHVLNSLKQSVNYQYDIVYMLTVGIIGHQKIHRNARENIMDVGHTTVDVLNTLDPRPCHGGQGLAATFTVLAAVAGIGATVATGGTAIAVGAAGAIAGGAAGLTPGIEQYFQKDRSSTAKNDDHQHLPSFEKYKVKIEGDSPSKVLLGMNKAIVALLTDIDTAERCVANRLDNSLKSVNDQKIYHNLVPPLTRAKDFMSLGDDGIGSIDSTRGMYHT